MSKPTPELFARGLGLLDDTGPFSQLPECPRVWYKRGQSCPLTPDDWRWLRGALGEMLDARDAPLDHRTFVLPVDPSRFEVWDADDDGMMFMGYSATSYVGAQIDALEEGAPHA